MMMRGDGNMQLMMRLVLMMTIGQEVVTVTWVGQPIRKVFPRRRDLAAGCSRTTAR